MSVSWYLGYSTFLEGNQDILVQILAYLAKKKLEHCGFMTHFKMKEIGEKTHICSISSVILGLNSENIYFGHFSVKNQDTGQKKSFCNSALKCKPWYSRILPLTIDLVQQDYKKCKNSSSENIISCTL